MRIELHVNDMVMNRNANTVHIRTT